MKVVIIMGSKSDLDWSQRISKSLETFGIESIIRIASAHKVPFACYEIIKKYEQENVVFITVAGMSNALSGFSDAQTYCPVIACPPYSEKFAGLDLLSTVRMPSGVAPLTVLSPENAALAAAKIIGIANPSMQEKVREYQSQLKESIDKADKELQQSN